MVDQPQPSLDRVDFTATTCWLLGAGASYDCYGTGHPCLPLTRSLIETVDVTPELAATLDGLESRGLVVSDDGCRGLGSRLEETIDRIRKYCESPDLEVSACAAECLQKITNLIARKITMAQLRVFLNPERSSGQDPAVYSAQNYLWLARACSSFQDWSVITLNWDRLLDWAYETWEQFSEVQVSPQYSAWKRFLESLESRSEVYTPSNGASFVKLHGSLDLYSCHDQKCKNYRAPFYTKAGIKGLGFHYSITPHSYAECPLCGKAAIEVVLPPGENKTQGEGAFHNYVYAEAERVLGRSDTWIAVGYSFPDYDKDISRLFRRALTHTPTSGWDRNIWVVNPEGPDVTQRLAKAIGFQEEGETEMESLGTDKVFLRGAPMTFSSFVRAVSRGLGGTGGKRADNGSLA